MSDDDAFGDYLQRDAILAGLPARRASALLYLIESRSAQLSARARQQANPLQTADQVRQRDLAFLEAFATGAEPPRVPRIQDLERQATGWAELVPPSPRIRAALARRLGEKYAFTRTAVPALRDALGLDQEPVREAFQQLHGQPIESIYTNRPRARDRLRWFLSGLAGRIENLPPFWIAYTLTLTETVGATVLALPIAVAGLGPLPGVVLLVVLGLINVLTIAWIAESVSRSSRVRYGPGFLGQVVEDYLGPVAAVVLSVGVFVFCFVLLQVFYVGFGTSLHDVTGVPAVVWVVLLFGLGIVFLRRGSLDATVASSLVVAVVNVAVVITLAAVAFAHARPGNLLYVDIPVLDGRPLDKAIIGVVFGVILTAYFGHQSVSTCARVSLQRDPSSRSLMGGAVAAQLTAIVLYSVFVLAVNGAIDPQTLAATQGTALAPLADRVGPVVYVLGAVFVLLGMGMGSIQLSVFLFNLIKERLPTATQTVLLLPRRQGRALFAARRRGPELAVTYLGLEGGFARFRLDAVGTDRTERLDHVVRDGSWPLLDESSPLRQRFPELEREHGSVTVAVLDADPQAARVRITTSRRLSYEGSRDPVGVDLADVIGLAPEEAEVVGVLVREGPMVVDHLAVRLGRPAAETQDLLDAMVTRGFLTERIDASSTRYAVQHATRPGRGSAAALLTDNPDADPAAPAAASPAAATAPAGPTPPAVPSGRPRPAWLEAVVAHPAGSFVFCVVPIVGAFLLACFSLLSGAGSFTGLLGLIGIVVVPILGGILPGLMLYAARRRGEFVPSTVLGFLGNRALLVVIYLVFLASILVHGVVVWTAPVPRLVALAVSATMIVVTVIMLRTARRRLTVEIRTERGRTHLSAVLDGRPHVAGWRVSTPAGTHDVDAADTEIDDADSIRRIEVRPRPGQPRPGQLKVWAHQLTADGDSEGQNGEASVVQGDHAQTFDLAVTRGEAVVDLVDDDPLVQLSLRRPGP